MIVAVVEGEGVFGHAGMAPPRAELRAAGKIGWELINRNTGGQIRPSLIQERNAAWRQPGRPDQVDRIGLSGIDGAGGGDAEEVAFHYVQKVARRKPIRG